MSKPFLRWAGGKTWLLNDLSDLNFSSIENYYEPFLGGGSFYIFLRNNNLINNKAFLSDSNNELINAFNVVKNNIEELIESLKKHKNNKKYYYEIRSSSFENNVEAASRFIYLNRTSYNGIYRVNLKGEYNVPYGNKKYKALFDFDNLRQVSRLIQNDEFECCDFSKSIKNARKGDLVFFDPPYTIAHENNNFVKYNQKIFSWNDQILLKKIAKKLHENDINYILTNANHESINNLYENFSNKSIHNRYSLIGGKGAQRKKYSELVITNLE